MEIVKTDKLEVLVVLTFLLWSIINNFLPVPAQEEFRPSMELMALWTFVSSIRLMIGIIFEEKGYCFSRYFTIGALLVGLATIYYNFK